MWILPLKPLKHFFHTVDMKNADFITVGEKGAKFVTLLNGHILADFSHQLPFTSKCVQQFFND